MHQSCSTRPTLCCGARGLMQRRAPLAASCKALPLITPDPLPSLPTANQHVLQLSAKPSIAPSAAPLLSLHRPQRQVTFALDSDNTGTIHPVTSSPREEVCSPFHLATLFACYGPDLTGGLFASHGSALINGMLHVPTVRPSEFLLTCMDKAVGLVLGVLSVTERRL